MKKCSECGELKDLSQFRIDIKYEDGVANECITCASKCKYINKICPICLKTFEAKYHGTKYCSDACKARVKYKYIRKKIIINKMEMVVCPICKKSFQAKPKSRKYCSDACREEVAQKKRKEISEKARRWRRENILSKNYHKICAFCKKSFVTGYRYVKYCSLQCSQQAQKIQSQKYYLLKHGWNIFRFQVFERDGFKCQYCGRIPWKHNVVLVVDHMKSRMNDGQDILTNLITSCEECNVSKGSKNLLDERLLRIIKKRTEKYLEKIDKNQIVINF